MSTTNSPNITRLTLLILCGVIFTSVSAQEFGAYNGYAQPQQYYQQNLQQANSEYMTQEDLFNLSPEYNEYSNYAPNNQNYNQNFGVLPPPSLVGVVANLSSVIQWVIATNDNQGLPFVVADKPAGMIYVVGVRGEILDQSFTLYGKHVGDEAVAGQTPAGSYTLQKHYTDEPGYSGDVMFFWREGDADYALHRTYTLYPKERRNKRVATPTPRDNRVSNGCINVPNDIYNRTIGNLHGSKLYVMPEHSNVFSNYHRGLNFSGDFTDNNVIGNDGFNPY